MKPLEPIRAELTGDHTATAAGISAKTNAGPALALCRKLIDAGFDVRRPLHCYRGDTLCLIVTSIGWGARYTIARGNEWQTLPTPLQAARSGGGGAPMRQNEMAATSPPTEHDHAHPKLRIAS
jgi:hypothetical protein